MKKIQNDSFQTSDTYLFTNKEQEWIEVVSNKELISSFIFFLVILFSLIYFALFGQQDVTTLETQKFPFSKKNPSSDILYFDFNLLPFNNRNRFLKFYVSFCRNKTSKTHETLAFKYLIKLIYPNVTEENIWQSAKINFRFEKDQICTQNIPLYNDYILEFKSISLLLKLFGANHTIFNSMVLSSLYCSTSSTTFIIYFIMTFSFFMIFSLVLLIYKNYTNQIDQLRIEQIFIIMLSIFMLFSNNPLYYIFCKHGSEYYYFFKILTGPICDGCIYFVSIFSIYLATSCDEHVTQHFSVFTTSKRRLIKFSLIYLFFILFFIFTKIFFDFELTIHNYFDNFPGLNGQKKIQNIMKNKGAFVAVFPLIALSLELNSLLINKIINRTSIVYILLFIPTFIFDFCFDGLLTYFGILGEDYEGEFQVSKMLIQNLFCLSFIYIHWPADIREQYEQMGEKGQLIETDNPENLLIEKDSLVDL